MSDRGITIRHSTEVDRAELLRLAELDGQHAPDGETLLAYVGGELRAAVSLNGARATLADPFHLTNDLVELLRLRARQERRSGA